MADQQVATGRLQGESGSSMMRRDGRSEENLRSMVSVDDAATFTVSSTGPCESGQFEKNGKCHKCWKTCAECNGPARSHCTVCKPELPIIHQRGGCVRSCEAGYFVSQEKQKRCIKCEFPCKTCVRNATTCTRCHKTTGKAAFKGRCVEECPEGTYTGEGHFQGACMGCLATCKTCDSKTSCLSCSPPLVLEIDERKKQPLCLQSCSAGRFADEKTRSCGPCDKSCATCSSSASNCTSCPTGTALHGSKCVEECPDGKYSRKDGNGGVCAPCHSMCKTCNGPTECLSCPTPKFLDKGEDGKMKCFGECFKGKYPDEERICRSCDDSCATCSSSASNCTSCREESVLDGSKCVDECPEGKFKAASGACQNCSAPCANCEGSATKCTSCEGKKVLHDSVCKSACPSTHFSTDNRICEPCGAGCKTCSKLPANCTSCKEPMVLKGEICENETIWTSSDWVQKKNTSLYDIGENTCQEWDCAAGSSCKNSVIQGVCFEGKVKGGDIQFDWTLTEPLKDDRKLRFTVDQFKCGTGLTPAGQTVLHSYDQKGGYQICSYSMADQMSYDEFVLTACKDAMYLYFSTTACEGLPRFSSIAWVS